MWQTGTLVLVFRCPYVRLWDARLACGLNDNRGLLLHTETHRTMALIGRMTKPCPGCGTPVEKLGGCNQMVCLHCNCSFCWLCMEQVDRGTFPVHFQVKQKRPRVYSSRPPVYRSRWCRQSVCSGGCVGSPSGGFLGKHLLLVWDLRCGVANPDRTPPSKLGGYVALSFCALSGGFCCSGWRPYGGGGARVPLLCPPTDRPTPLGWQVDAVVCSFGVVW